MNSLLLVLDLDETLIASTDRDGFGYPHDFEVFGYPVYKRPFLNVFMETCYAVGSVAVWTNAQPDYASQIVAQVFGERPLRFFFTAVESAELTTPSGSERKGLAKVEALGYRRERVIAIDDTPAKWACSRANCLPVEPFLGDPADRELERLGTFLRGLDPDQPVGGQALHTWRTRTPPPTD